MARPYVIVGASLAGANAAFTLREEGYDGRVVLIGEEADLPYERPPLSKEYLRGERPFEKSLVRPVEAYAEQSIELELGLAATRLVPGDRLVELADGRTIAYERVLLATGGSNRRLPIPGIELDGVHDLRTRADADGIRDALVGAERAVVVGLGFIGSEIAASLRQLGLEVVAVEPFAVPLERALGADVGRAIAELHRENGVSAFFGESVEAFEGRSRVERVRTSAGRTIDCDLCVVGLGLEPNVALGREAGLDVDDGIAVDDLCRTSAPDVFAAGDVAASMHPLIGRRIRVEHWLNAIEQGAAAARSMLGKGSAYAEIPWFWSDQYDANLQYAGHHRTWDDLVVRGSIDERRFVAFYLESGVARAAVALNMGRDLRRAMTVIRSGVAVEPDLLRDPEIDLRKLAPA